MSAAFKPLIILRRLAPMTTVERSKEHWLARVLEGAILLSSLLGVAVVFLPFALDTSPLDAVMLKVPGNQGNWWHALIGVPFFLAFPMLRLHLLPLISDRSVTPVQYRILWTLISLSVAGTLAVETPFLLHLAGTSEWQRLAVLTFGVGIVLVSAASLIVRRREIDARRACIVGLNSAFLANATLCLVVYGGTAGSVLSRLGWWVTLVIIWPFIVEVAWTLGSPRLRQPI
jgi:hypothetical protein